MSSIYYPIYLAYTPILLAIWRFSSEAAPGTPLTGLTQRVWWLLQAFTIWKATLSPNLSITIPVITIIFILCAYLVQSSEFRVQSSEFPIPNPQSPNPPIANPRLLTTLLLLIPFIIANILLSRNHLAFFGERYFIIMTPWLLILAALGTDSLGYRLQNFTFHAPRPTSHVPRPTSYIPIVILLVTTTIPLFTLWNPTTTKEAWRQSVAYLAKIATDKHGVLIHPDWVRYPFQYYFKGPGQTYAAFSTVTADTLLEAPLQGVISDHEVIWLVQSHLATPDPERRVEQWFATRYPLVTELYPPGVTLKGYAPGYQLDTLPPAAQAVDIAFDNGLRLVGHQTDPAVSANDDLFHPPSGWVHVTLYWQADNPIEGDLSPFVHLVGPAGVWGVNLARTTDALKLYPTSGWTATGPIIRHDMDVNLNPAIPPGVYQMVVGLPDENIQYPFAEVEVRE